MAATEDRDQLVRLLHACAQGDEAAFARLYRAASPKLYGLALRIVKEEYQAQECLQDGFVRIWEHAGDYRQERGAPMTWMGIIVRRRALDMVRRRRREQVAADPEDLERRLDELTALEGGGLDHRVDPREREALLECLGQLGKEQRESLRLAYFEGLTHPELAERLQAPLGTVKTWVRRGLERLKRCLEP